MPRGHPGARMSTGGIAPRTSAELSRARAPNLFGLNTKHEVSPENKKNIPEFEYAVVIKDDIDEFVNNNEDMVETGWSLHGGLVVDKERYYQAFTRRNPQSRSKELRGLFGGKRTHTRKNTIRSHKKR